jgi:hypothetical protein
MIILEQPYVSEFLQKTVVDLQIPVLKTDFVLSLPYAKEMNLLDNNEFIKELKKHENPMLYSNSENSGVWLNQFCPELKITQQVNRFKDKSKLREIMSSINPDVWFKTCSFDDLFTLDITQIPKPFVIKPLRGFASICIFSIFNNGEWFKALVDIKKEAELMKDVFPDVVVSLNEFILERYIHGTEIAIDAYFDHTGSPVILNILTHHFTSPLDMSDRLYITSDEIITSYYHPILKYISELGRLCNLKNFPFHLEMRQEDNGSIIPMEINPMRFMGFCVADVEYYFYGINPYEYFFHHKKPDWNTILSSREDTIYGMMGIDIPKQLDKSKIRFDYDKFIGYFTKPLQYVKMDYTKFPMSIYMFAEVKKNNFKEFEYILHSDLKEFITRL